MDRQAGHEKRRGAAGFGGRNICFRLEGKGLKRFGVVARQKRKTGEP